MFEVGVVDNVVVRQLGELPVPQQVAAGVAHVGEGVGLAAQHQGRQGGEAQLGAAFVQRDQPGVLRGDDAVQRDAGVPGGWCAKIITHQTGDCRLRCLFAHATHAHPIGQRHDDAHIFVVFAGQHRACEVFVDGFGAG